MERGPVTLPRVSCAEPALSVVIPAYRVEDYLEVCLDSILADPDPDVEVIVVDDASPDRSGEIAEKYAQHDPRVRVERLAENVGLSDARNAGLARARGDYVWFIDGDDWVPDGSVAAIRERLAAHRPDVLVVDLVWAYSSGQRISATPPGLLSKVDEPGPLSRYPQLLSLPHSACTKIVRRKLLDEIDLRFTPGWYEDCAFSHRLLLAAGRIDALDRVCYFYRQRSSDTITKSVSPRHFDVFDQYERVWQAVEDADGRYDSFRPELFRLMLNHLLVIVGNEQRLPAGARREFFRRTVAAYRRYLPPAGYPAPRGIGWIKHRLVRHNAYWTWAVLRLVWRTTRLGGTPEEAAARNGAATKQVTV